MLILNAKSKADITYSDSEKGAVNFSVMSTAHPTEHLLTTLDVKYDQNNGTEIKRTDFDLSLPNTSTVVNTKSRDIEYSEREHKISNPGEPTIECNMLYKCIPLNHASLFVWNSNLSFARTN